MEKEFTCPGAQLTHKEIVCLLEKENNDIETPGSFLGAFAINKPE